MNAFGASFGAMLTAFNPKRRADTQHPRPPDVPPAQVPGQMSHDPLGDRFARAADRAAQAPNRPESENW
jgi:hypothetical protein